MQPGQPPEQVQQVSPTPDRPVRALFNPLIFPLRGMNSFKHPMGLNDNDAAYLQNLRLSDTTMQARYGITKMSPSGLPTPANNIFRGATYWQGKFYSAYLNGTNSSSLPVVDLYVSDPATWTSGGSGGMVWSKLTLSTGAKQGTDGSSYTTTGGDNRLLDNGTNVEFVAVSSPMNLGVAGGNYLLPPTPILIACNGATMVNGVASTTLSNFPRILNGQALASPETQATSTRIAIHRSGFDGVASNGILPPNPSQSVRSYVTLQNPINVTVTGTTSVSGQFPENNSTATTTGSDPADPSLQMIQWTGNSNNDYPYIVTSVGGTDNIALYSPTDNLNVILTATVVSTTVTCTTKFPHGFSPGDHCVISGALPAGWSGLNAVTSILGVTSATIFTVTATVTSSYTAKSASVTFGAGVTNTGAQVGVTWTAHCDLSSSKQLCIVGDSTHWTYGSFWDNFMLEACTSSNNTYYTIWDPRNGNYDRVELPFNNSGSYLIPNPDPNLQRKPNFSGVTGQMPGPLGSYSAEAKNLSLVAFSLDTLQLPTIFSPNTFRFTYVGATIPAPGGSTVVQNVYSIFMIAASGQLAGLGQFAGSFYNTDAQAESSGCIIQNGGGDLVSNLGGPAAVNLQIPEAPSVYYVPVAPVMAPSSTQVKQGVDAYLLYRQEYTEDQFYLLGGGNGYYQIAQWILAGGSPALSWTMNPPSWSLRGRNWAAISGNPGPQTLYTSLPYDLGRNLTVPAPDAFSGTIAPFSAAQSGSNRLFAANGDTLQVSDSRLPFRHRQIVRFANNQVDLSSGSQQRFDNQTITAVSTVAASTYGANQAYIWTNSASYSVDTGDPRQTPSYLGPVGCLSRDSLSTYKNEIWLYDDQRQIRRYNYGDTNEPSRMVVEDFIRTPIKEWFGTYRGIPQARSGKVTSTWFRDRMYFGFTACNSADGTTPSPAFNSSVLVYDTRTGGWCVDTGPTGFSAEQFVTFDDPTTGRQRMLAFGHDGNIFEYEDTTVTQDFGSNNISVAWWTKMYHAEPWGPSMLMPRPQAFPPLSLSRVGVICDPVTGQSATITRIGKGGNSNTSTISLTANATSPWADRTGEIWRWCDAGVSLRDSAILVKFTASVPAGWRLYSANAELESCGGGGADVG